MSTVSNLDSSIGVALCAHTHQSGRLRFDDSRALTAWLVCDDCEETVDFLPRQTSAAATHPAAAQAESSAVRDASQAA
ncbi:MAG TPA: hypothetical protein VHS74_08745 [Solirubrobacterales bacterium]|jgi:hypothetical protein|nr:hypothetical protein [Solirubrobacterales bacterium]